jgi:hypothetical protein
MDYVIAVRSYARAHDFPQMTYKVLHDAGLTSILHIFVASPEEKQTYQAALGDRPYKEIIVGELGGANAIRAICNYFPIGQRIVFMDDDFRNFGYVHGPADLTGLLADGFQTIDKYNCGAFTFDFISNRFWLKDKPRKIIRPFHLVGGFFATRNDPALIITDTSHCDDLIRSVRYIERYGGVLVYSGAYFRTKYGTEPGGMQQSGDRANTAQIVQALYDSDPVIRAYAVPPFKEKQTGYTSIKLKKLPALKKAMVAKGITPLVSILPGEQGG